MIALPTYAIYVFIASMTIASPGPGVVMTLTNALKYGLKKSLSGILGVATGMFFISVLAGSGVGVLIANSERAYNILKMSGAIYLFYLGFKLIKNRNSDISVETENDSISQKKSFAQGLGVTMVNPKPIIFFLALFPQFISHDAPYLNQFILLSFTFCVLIIFIHIAYGIFASYIQKQMNDVNYFKYINIFGGLAYIIFALSLAVSEI